MKCGERFAITFQRFAKLNPKRCQQKRAALSHVSAVFDPLSLLAPFTMRMRILLKTVWKQTGQEFDKALQDGDVVVFDAWAEELKLVKEIHLQCQYFANSCLNY